MVVGNADRGMVVDVGVCELYYDIFVYQLCIEILNIQVDLQYGVELLCSAVVHCVNWDSVLW